MKKYFGAADVARFSMTCKRFSVLVNDNDLWEILFRYTFRKFPWPHMYGKDKDTGFRVYFYSLLKNRFKHIKNVKLLYDPSLIETVHRDPKKPIEFQTAVLGYVGVGKSALMVRFVMNIFVQQYDPSVEDTYRKIHTFADTKVLFNILDTAGPTTPLRHAFVRNSPAAVFVFSITDRKSFEHVHHYKNEFSLEIYHGCILVGNKCDLADQRQVSQEEAEELAVTLGGVYIETSAKTATNVDRIFEEAFWSYVHNNAFFHDPQKSSGKCSIM